LSCHTARSLLTFKLGGPPAPGFLVVRIGNHFIIDRVFPGGRVEKIPLSVQDAADALTLADDDIDENWARYKEQFLRGWRQ